ncbi:beta-propeller fold lactonase family protein [Saccharothrix variisporea]|uniref:YVTN family beta-propeller protein n=1 Tax=Saccharothrix variisporea TaxID=543527 RepID=A0A495XB44_9PSEU|nr:beta-propeller fold lactonase family protein [Saccharothrix variisporea]RKT71217.1 YVTN family beta-propeller protein [Saccharothrix variisporea]
MHEIRRRSAALGVLVTAGLVATTLTAPTAAAFPEDYIVVDGIPSTVVTSQNGALAYVSVPSKHAVSVIDTASRTVVDTIPVGIDPHGIALTSNGRTAYITDPGDSFGDKGSAAVVDLATKQATTLSVAPMNNPQAVAVSPDGTKAYVVGYGYSMAVIDTATKTVTSVYTGARGATDVKVTPDGSRVYIADFDGDRVIVFGTEANSVIAAVPLPTHPNRLAIMPDGRHVYVSSYGSDKVYMIATAGNYVGAAVTTPHPVALEPAPNGRMVHVLNYEEGVMTSIDVATNTVLATREAAELYPWSLAIARSGTEAYTLLPDNRTVVVLDIAAEPGPDRVVAGETLAAGQSKTSPDGRYRLTMQTDGNLVLYNASGEAQWHTHTDGSGATRAVLQYDGNFVVYGNGFDAKWHTNTWRTPADRFVVQNDSNLVLYGPEGFPHWHRW